MFNIIIIIIIVITVTSIPFHYKLYPPCTHSSPLTRPFYEIIPLSSSHYPSSSTTQIEIERYFTNDTTNPSNLIDRQLISLYSPVIKLYDYNSKKGRWWNQSGYNYEYIRVRMIYMNVNNQSEVIEEEYQEGGILYPIVWDYRFYYIEYKFDFKNEGSGKVIVEAIVDDKYKEYDKYTMLYFYQTRSPVNLGVYNVRNWYNWVSESNKFRWIFEKPGIIYLALRSHTGYGSAPISSGLESYRYSPRYYNSNQPVLALVCCYENGTCPEIDPSLVDPVVQYVEIIPNDIQIPILENDITILEGMLLGFPLFMNPQYIDIELPFNITFGDWYVPTYYKTTRNSVPGHENYNSYKLTRTSTQWSYKNRALNLAFKFNKKIKLNKKYKMYIKVEGGVWQEILITPKSLYKLPKTPTRLTFSDTWGSISMYESFQKYADIGYNYVPGPSYISNYQDYSPSRRKEWPIQMRFAPQNSLFHSERTSLSPKLYSLFAILQETAPIPSYLDSYGLNSGERTIELQKWQNAIDFFQSQVTYPKVDPCYDGILYKRHLEVFFDYLNYTRPDHINFDIESFGSWNSYLSNDMIQNSQNCMDRKLPQESLEEMYYRITEKILSDIKDAFIAAGLGNIPITFYGLQSANNAGYQLAKFETYKKYGIIPQPSVYIYQKSNFIIKNVIRSNKQYLIGNSYESAELIRDYKAYNTFDWMIHFFCNGATGFMFYNPSRADNMEHYLLVNEAIHIFVSYEDIIMNSKLASHDFTFENCIVSAIKDIENTYLVAVTSIKGEFIQDCSVKLPYDSIYYSVKNLRTKKRVKSKMRKNEISFTLSNERSAVLLIKIDYFSVISVIISAVISTVLLLIIIVVLVCICICSLGGSNNSTYQKKGKRDQFKHIQKPLNDYY